MTQNHLAERPQILVIDDHVELAETIAAGLSGQGFSAQPISSAAEATLAIAQGQHDALVCDLRIPGTDGLELLAQSRTVAPSSPVIVMTAFSEIDTAIESIRRGAYHYMTKPFKIDELSLFLRRALEESALRREARSLRNALRGPLENMIGNSPEMREVFNLVRRVADSAASVLILGETGTGKGLIARALHAESPRAGESFVSLNCAAIPDALLESELFGHVKGAFTGATNERVGLFEQAHRGTLFLDEIAEMSPAIQAKLLHVLESGRLRPVGSNTERQVNVRILAATHRDIRLRVQQGLFRGDLLYRLDVVSVELPPLRCRRDDLPGLIAHFAAAARKKTPGAQELRISPEVMDVLMSYEWPGNVRELEHVIERLTLLCRNGESTLKELPKNLTARVEDAQNMNFGNNIIPLRELQGRYVAWALQKLGGAKMATCDALAIDPKTLNKWLRTNTGSDGEA